MPLFDLLYLQELVLQHHFDFFTKSKILLEN